VPLSSTRLFGFKPPFVKDGEVVVPVLSGAGEWSELIATPATWQRMALALGLHFEPKPAPPKPRKEPAFIVAPAEPGERRSVHAHRNFSTHE
jgi:hypothetical protein